MSKKDEQEIVEFFEKNLQESSSGVQLLIFVPKAEECEYCEPLKQLATELVAISKGKVSTRSLILEDSKELADKYNVRRAPATVVTLQGDGSGPALKFYGLPSGYEFTALLNDIADVANSHPSSLSSSTIDQAKKVKSKVHIQVFVTPTCPYCPKAVRTAHQLSMANPEMIDSEMIESMEFPELSERYSVMAVPKIVINENVEFEGALPEQMFLSKIEEALSA